MKNKEWPVGSLKLVSREAYDSVRRTRGYEYMNPEQRLEAAKGFDALFSNDGKDPVQFHVWYSDGQGRKVSVDNHGKVIYP